MGIAVKSFRGNILGEAARSGAEGSAGRGERRAERAHSTRGEVAIYKGSPKGCEALARSWSGNRIGHPWGRARLTEFLGIVLEENVFIAI